MINIVTALPCEAKPLVNYFRLNSRQADGFRIYEHDQLRLIVSGIGKTAAAAATAYLQGIKPGLSHAWLNIGIAGHPTLSIGEGILASKITDQNSGLSWYPPLVFETTCRRTELVTVDSPAFHYHGNYAHDMEASGFYATACRFSSGETIQVFKVISDNKNHSAETVSAAQVEEIIAGNIDAIDKIISQLTSIQTKPEYQTASAEVVAQFTQRWHFTTTQQHQLNRLLQRIGALQPGATIETQHFSTAHNSKELLKLLESHLHSLPVIFD